MENHVWNKCSIFRNASSSANAASCDRCMCWDQAPVDDCLGPGKKSPLITGVREKVPLIRWPYQSMHMFSASAARALTREAP